jgi:hypothetical protein
MTFGKGRCVKRCLLAGSVVAILGVAALSPAAFGASGAAGKPLSKRHAITRAQADTAGVRSTQTDFPKADPAAQSARAPQLSLDLHAVAGVPGAQGLGLPNTKLESDGSVEVTVTGPRAAAGVRAAGGRILAQAGAAVTATIRPSALRGLAATPGVASVRKPTRAVTLADSEGVAKSGAAAWHAAGQRGAGVTIAVVDTGFANLTEEKLTLPPNLPVLTVVNGNHCADVNKTQHGTAVAEIVHQMAPDAQLLLYCVDDNVGFASAETELQAAGATVVNSSLGFPGDSRGDGYGAADSTATTVRTARQAGILWVQSAGNSAADHWSGTLADADHDGYVDLNGTGSTNSFDVVSVPPSGVAQLFLQWDQWPTSSATVALRAVGLQCIDAACSGYAANQVGSFRAAHGSGTKPVLDISTPVNTSPYDQDWVISVEFGTGAAARRYDLNYYGDVEGFPSYLAGTNPARGAAGSMSEPASSPYAFAVGAANQADNTLEQYSSRGSTIDGRIKPDILGFDGTTSNLSEFSGGFYGTSAAAPHVAGAAALVAAANPAMDAAQIQAFLQARAASTLDPTTNVNPATNASGHGLLNLRQPTGIAPDEGSLFTPMDPIRVLETRPAYGGAGIIQPNHEVTVTPPPAVPSDATAVMINLTGVGATGPAFLSAYPNSYSGVSNVDLSKTDPTLAVAATVALNANHQFKVRASVTALNALVDVVGYYRPASAASGTGFQALTPTRILDTRYATGGHQRPVLNNEQMTIHATGGASGVPITATAVVFNLTAVNMSGPGYLSAFPTTFKNTSTLDYGKYTMANLATVQLASGPSPAAGTFQLLNRGPAVNAIIDVVGYFDASAPGQFHVLPSPVRIADTRTGNGGRYGALAGSGPNATLTLDAAGVGEVPLAASAVWVGVIAVPTSIGYLTVYPAGQNKPLASTVDFTSGRAIANAAVTGLGSRDFSITESGGGTHAVADLFGYFK